MSADDLARVRAFIAAKDYEQARKTINSIPATDPSYAEAMLLSARCSALQHDWRECIAAAQESIDLVGENFEALRLIAEAQRGLNKFPETVAALERVFRHDVPPSELPLLLRRFAYALYAVKRRDDAIKAQREAIGYREDGLSYTELAEYLYKDGRNDEAVAASRKALDLDPNQTRARGLLLLINAPKAKQRQKWIPYPGRTTAFEEPRAIIQSSVLRGYPKGAGPFITSTTKFLTMGSCFAHNLAKRLRANNLDVFSEFIGEEVNSTYANKYFLRWVESGVSDTSTQLMEDNYGPSMRTRFRQAAENCDAFIFTLGVAPCFFHTETGEFFFTSLSGATQQFLFDNFVMRTTTVDENIQNMQEIIETVRRLRGGDPQIILTVSPVPLGATAEMPSAVIADCLSKSTLRLACEAVCSSDFSGSVHYWPSFEIVRWLGPHFAPMHPPVFGAQDSKTRHVSQWIVDLIVDLFIETYTKREAISKKEVAEGASQNLRDNSTAATAAE